MKKTDHMHDPEFEKQVQKKMEELTFNPSASVWTTVEQKIKKDKKRDRGLFLFFLCLGLGLSGGLYFLLNLNRPEWKETKRLAVQKLQTSTNSTEPRIIKDKIQTGKMESIPATPVFEKLKPKTLSSKKINPVLYASETRKKIYSIKRGEKNGEFSRKAILGTKDILAISKPSKAAITIRENNVVNVKEGRKDQAAHISAGQKEDSSKISINKVAEVPVQEVNGTDSLESPIKLTTEAKKTQLKNKFSGWKLAYAAGLGISTIQNGFLKPGTVADPAVTNSSIPPAFAPGGGNGFPASSIKPGISLSAGLFVKRIVSKKIVMSIGLQYHYYSTHIQIGNKVDSSKSISTLNAGSNRVMTINGYYQSGSTENYTNHYHFIELPVNLLFQLNNNSKIPFYWEVGILASEFINSDALHYNWASGIYYKDNGLFNKTQFSFSTGFLVGLNNSFGSFQFGPQFQYQLTDLLRKNQGNKEHLFFGGIQLIFIPQKK